jgi:putative transposase
MKSEMIRISEPSKFRIHTLEVDEDHMHLLIDSSPVISAAQIVRKLKQESTISVWKQFPQILKRHFWKERTFWTDGYFVSTTGQASEETIRKYIENQG